MIRSKFSLLLVAGSLAFTASAAQPSSPHEPPVQYAAILSTKNMCCAKESVPAIKELSKLQGVGRVTVNHKTRTVYILPTDVALSPRGIWEAAERVQIVPIRLATPEGVFTSKPRY